MPSGAARAGWTAHASLTVPGVKGRTFVPLTSGYIQRSLAQLPRQGSRAPWRVYQNYIRDVISLKWGTMNNDSLEFSNPPKAGSTPPPGEIGQTKE